MLVFMLIFIVVPLFGGGVAGADEAFDARALWTTLSETQSIDYHSPRSLSSFASLVDTARSAVVALHTFGSTEVSIDKGLIDRFRMQPWRLFPEVPRKGRQVGIGSGFIIRQDGYVVTNHHVVAHATSVVVRVANMAAALKARVVGLDPRSDLALLKVNASRPLPVLPLGSSEKLPVGAWVVAIGNPFGLTHIATKGIVSGKGRALHDLEGFRARYFDFIQTDAAIDRGNSGGPLLNLRGEVVGINTAINSQARGIGFAVPIDLAKAVLPQLLQHGRVIESYLGIRIDPVSWEIAESFGLAVPSGVLIAKVIPNTPADRAGLRRGDILLRFAGIKIRGPGDMNWRASTAPVGKAVEVEIWRSGKRVVLSLTPVARKAKKASRLPTRQSKVAASFSRLGLQVMDLDVATAKASGLPESTRGVVVVGVEADSAMYDIRVGDIITSVDDAEVSNRQEFQRAIQRVKKNHMLRLYIIRQQGARYVALPKRWDE